MKQLTEAIWPWSFDSNATKDHFKFYTLFTLFTLFTEQNADEHSVLKILIRDNTVKIMIYLFEHAILLNALIVHV